MPDEVWALRCRCGLEITGPSRPGLVAAVNAHLDQEHPQLTGTYEDQDVLSLAHRKPTRRDVAS